MNEIWKDIDGYNGKYQVSNYGRVKSLKYGKEKILIQVKMKNGYLYVNLYKEGKVKTCRVHRLVCQAFLDNPNGYTCVNHKDECKTNNCVDNLEWCSVLYNNTFGSRIKTIAEKQSKKVYQYDKQGNLIKIWKSTAEAGRNGYKQSTVSNCCLGKLKTHRGFKWSYTPINPK